MFDLEIDQLRLTLHNASGHEHRVASIAERAAALLAERIDERWRARQTPPAAQPVPPSAQPPAVNLDLSMTGDEQAASLVAAAWLEALALRIF